MAVKVLRNTRVGSEPAAPETHDDGTLFPYCMFYDGFKFVAYADTPEDLMSVLIPGYDQLADEQLRLAERIKLAISAQVVTQAQILASADPADLDALSDEETAVLTGPRFEQPKVDMWSSPIPLVLVDTGYSPYTDVDRPISAIADVLNPPNINWLRPMDTWELLDGLRAIEYIDITEATDL